MAQRVIDYTRADAVMIGRAAQGQPWLFGQVAAFIKDGSHLPMPTKSERISTIVNHINEIHQFYGDVMGVRLARKHIKWYLQHWQTPIPDQLRSAINRTESQNRQLELLCEFLDPINSMLAA